MLLNISKVLKCGTVKFLKKNQLYKYEIKDLNLIKNNIVSFFEKYPLISSKKNDFELFKKIINLITLNKNLTYEQLIEIINISFLINNSNKKKYSKKFILNLINKMKV